MLLTTKFQPRENNSRFHDHVRFHKCTTFIYDRTEDIHVLSNSYLKNVVF